jgi:uncharacterized protein (TIGR03067 family)
MKQARLALCVFSALLTFLAVGWAGENPQDALQGAWVAQSLEVNGKPAPAPEFKTLRFTFKKDKLIVRGNFGDDGQEECPYQIDAKKTPKHFEFTPSKEKMPILGIYEIKGDELKICLRQGGGGARPTEFAAKEKSGLILVVFKKQK